MYSLIRFFLYKNAHIIVLKFPKKSSATQKLVGNCFVKFEDIISSLVFNIQKC